MTVERRSIDRRRRVLFSSMRPHAHDQDEGSQNDPDHRRAARSAPSAYGARVKRRLRSRWFSLVPIHRGSLLGLIAITFGIAFLICFGHYQTATSAFLLNHPEIARPLKIDQPSSFGQLMLLILTVCSAGSALMIYQLRRYRNDDFGGRYRVWRFAALLLTLQVFNLTTDLAGWSGALIDAALGQRVLLSGADWTRLVIDITGIALAIRLFLETKQYIYSACFLLAGCIFLSIGEFAAWRPVGVSTPSFWLLANSSSLMGMSAVFVSLVVYLRKVYRQVRQIDKIEANAKPHTQISADSDDEKACEKTSLSRNPTTFVGTLMRYLSPMTLVDWIKRVRANRKIESNEAPSCSETLKEANHNHPAGNQEPPQGTTKRWWSRRKPRSTDPTTHNKPSAKAIGIQEDQETVAEQETAIPTFQPSVDDNLELRHKDSKDETIPEDDIDWGSMNKSERRRLRKQLKRQRRAA